MPNLQILFNGNPIKIIPISTQTKAKANAKVILPQSPSPYPIDFLTSQKVNDEVRGYLIYNGAGWDFSLIQKNNIINITKKKTIKRIALILESPHKLEYDHSSSPPSPIKPAQGSTGARINKYITHYCTGWGLCSKYVYEVNLMNAIQYQTSCYNELILHNPSYEMCHPLRNRVFKLLWKSKANNLITRITKYKPDVIVNACTGGKAKYGLRNLVDSSITAPHFIENHPSTWK